MKVKLIILILLTLPFTGLSQTPKSQLLQELNSDMWRPFLLGIRADSAELYVGIHSEHFYWVAPGSKGRMMNLDEYDDDSRTVMARRQASGATSEMEVRFIERNITGEFAAEKAVVKFMLKTPGQAAEPGYGIVHYFSRKENGRWKMWLQYGSTEKATEQTYNSAAAMDDVEKFN